MRRELLTVLALAAPAHADVRALVAADSYAATEDAADVAWSAHVDWRDRARRAVFDWVERESLIGGTPRRELHELSYVDRSFEHLTLTLGRYRVPGGFWLIADGAALAWRTKTLEAGVFGGARAFTNGRTETHLTSSPVLLPLAGAALTAREGDAQGALAYTYTADRVELYRGDGAVATSREPEQFVDAELLAPVGEHGYLTGGATIGSRYLVTYPTAAARIADDPTLENVWFGSQAVYALVDQRLGPWRLAASLAATRTKLGQVTDPMALAGFAGAFGDATLRAGWRDGTAWRVDGRYRARVWTDGRHAHRVQAAGEWRRGALDVQGSAGLDLHRNADPASGLANGTSLLYRASVGRKTAASEAAVGVAAVAAIGDELAAGPDDTAGERAPYTLEARSYAFVRAFATRGSWFGGLDGEWDLHGDGARALLQVGWTR